MPHRRRDRRTSRKAHRRYLTIAFCDLSDSTALADAMDAEHYADLLDELKDAYEAVIPKHGGTVVQVRGDGILAMFGMPEASEDGVRRAIEAALELNSAVRRITVARAPANFGTLRMHSGIHSGLVLVIEHDASEHAWGRYELIGDAVNVAARLSAAAAADDVLVSEATLGTAGAFFDVEPTPPLNVKGKDRPVAAYRILGRSGITTRYEARRQRGLTPFTGRDVELTALDNQLRLANQSGPRTVAILAPAGLGKTRLVEEFLLRAAARGTRVLRGYCESYLSAEPLQAFIQVLRDVLGIAANVSTQQLAERLTSALAEIDPALLTHQGELRRLLSIARTEQNDNLDLPGPSVGAVRIILAAILRALAVDHALIVFVDDYQWADDGTRQLLTGMIDELAEQPVLLLTAARTFEPGQSAVPGAYVIELFPLTDAGATRTIQTLLPQSDPFTIQRIKALAGGNPLFIEELSHAASRDELDTSVSHVDSAPAWLYTLIESRMEKLSREQAALLRAAAVIGNVIPAWLLERLTGHGPDHHDVRELALKDLVFPGETEGTLRFKHGVTRDVIYDTVNLQERSTLHLRIANALEQEVQDEAYEALAYHYRAGQQPAKAAHYAELAGDKALAVPALDRARSHYRAALDALDLLDSNDDIYQRWMSLAARLGMTCVFDPPREQLEIFERAVNRATARGDLAGVANAEYWLGYINYALGESLTAIGDYEHALHHARSAGDEPLAVQVLATLGQARAAACDYDQALVQLNEAINVKRRHRRDNRPAVGSAYSLAVKGQVLGDRGDFVGAHACFDEALDAVKGAAHEVEGSVLALRTSVVLWQGDWAEGLRIAERTAAIAERVKSQYVFAMGTALAGYAGWMLQRSPAGIEKLRLATSWLEGWNKALFISLNYGWLADALADIDAFDEARLFAAKALRRARKRDRLGEAMAYRALARIAHREKTRGTERKRSGARNTVDGYLQRALHAGLARQSRHESAVTWLQHAELIATSTPTKARILLHEARDSFQAMDMRWHGTRAEQLIELL